ncbi:hypothetical protein CK218_27580 [Mesorhizobium sp. WSM3879]|nr:hypothetical protein [Mesorhizobium sp. WSM3879]PBB77870.1 hypothetical protein CK218_27580 [Mesorhizobium sp. WSM3879]
MSDHPGNADPHEGAVEILSRRLARETDITEEQARELIKLIGTDWNSLLR